MNKTSLLLLALASFPVQAAEDSRFLIRVMNVDRELAIVEVEGGSSDTRLQLHGIPQHLEIVRTSPREARALLPAMLAPGAYLLRVSHGAKSAMAREIPIDVGPVGPVVQEN
jgi:hypothetical protein